MASYEEAYAYLERRVDSLKTNRTGDERQTDAEVFDRKTLMTIYDKSDIENVSDAYLRSLVQQIESPKK